ncbi:unnamed protein product [Tetraodon nigroviridis]|uniref:(spotted green pufferfish) hypothetical protein n=1 Tax=Tetraodon nigroviridis TaxID=99883 RepID=Q4S7A4_TETNG|nr:unnamed protein product [Tetraodon nigroviridis]
MKQLHAPEEKKPGKKHSYKPVEGIKKIGDKAFETEPGGKQWIIMPVRFTTRTGDFQLLPHKRGTSPLFSWNFKGGT